MKRKELEQALKGLSAPPPQDKAQHRAVFLAEAEAQQSISKLRVMRFTDHEGPTKQQKGERKMRKWMPAVASVMLILALTVTGVVYGQEIVNFFTQDEDDTTEVTIVRPEIRRDDDNVTEEAAEQPAPDDIAPGDIIAPLSLADAIEQAPFDLQTPSFMPDNYTFEGAVVMDDHVMLIYQCRYGDWSLGIGQMPSAPEDVPDIEVGESATIETVMVGGASGQYVRGMWEIQHEEVEADTTDRVTIEDAVWNSESEAQQLHWYRGGVMYSVYTNSGFVGSPAGRCALFKDDFVSVARGLKHTE